jgi:hypothetical protein
MVALFCETKSDCSLQSIYCFKLVKKYNIPFLSVGNSNFVS